MNVSLVNGKRNTWDEITRHCDKKNLFSIFDEVVVLFFVKWIKCNNTFTFLVVIVIRDFYFKNSGYFHTKYEFRHYSSKLFFL